MSRDRSAGGVRELIRAADDEVIEGILEAIVYRKNAVMRAIIALLGLLFFLFCVLSERIEASDAELSLYLLGACGLADEDDVDLLLKAEEFGKRFFDYREVFFLYLGVFELRVG